MLRRTVWWEIIKENTAGTARNLGLKWAWDHPVILVLLLAIYVLLVWTQISAEAATLQIQERLLWIAAPFTTFIPWWIARLFVRTIPDREIGLQRRIARLAARLKPHYRAAAVDEPLVFRLNEQKTRNFLCLAVTNLSDRRSDMITASIIELVGDNGSVLREAIDLSWDWSVGGFEPYSVITSHGVKTVLVIELRETGGLGFFRASSRTDYEAFFDGGEKFTGKIIIDDRTYGGQLVHFVLTAKPLPRLEVLHSETTAPVEDAE